MDEKIPVHSPHRLVKLWTASFGVFLTAVLSLTGCGGQKQEIVNPNVKITEFTKPAVVRVVAYNTETYTLAPEVAKLLNIDQKYVEYDGGMGSGAIISTDGYIVTNAHVVESKQLEESKAEDQMDQQFLADMDELVKQADPTYAAQWHDYIVKTTEVGKLERIAQVYLPGGGDPLPFDIKSFGAPIGQGKDVSVIKIDTTNLPIIPIDTANTAQTEDQVTIAGYPGAADLQGFLNNKSQLVSTYSNGTIGALKTSDNGPIIQLSANINPGNSGGPVLSMNGQIIGLATAKSTDASGIGWAVPASTVLEYARQAGAVINQPGDVTKHWQQALNFYWQGYYKKALPEFEEVQRLDPHHYAIQDYITKSQHAIDSGKNRTDLSDFMPYIIGGTIGIIVIVSVGTTLIIVFRKKKKTANHLKKAKNRNRTKKPKQIRNTNEDDQDDQDDQNDRDDQDNFDD